jgi:hypothetical protein
MLQTQQPAPAASPALAEQELRLSGAARLALVLDLSRFVHPDDEHDFRHLRGSEAYADALRALAPLPPFGVDERTAAVERDGYALRVFRSRLVHNHFFPTYKVGWGDEMRARLEREGCADIRGWQHSAARFRFTRNGLAVVTLSRDLDNLPLIACVEQMLELQSGMAGPTPRVQDQWWLGRELLQALLDALERRIVLRQGGKTITIRFTDQPSGERPLHLDRYIIYSLRGVRRGGDLVSPAELKRDHAPLVAAFLEGSLLEHEGRRRLPSYEPDAARRLLERDCSTWTDELCLFTGESALMYRPLEGNSAAYIGGPLGLSGQAYASYWAAVERGVEHLVAFRSEAQQAERRTTDLLGKIPYLTRRVQDGQVTSAVANEIEHLAAGLSDIFDSLPDQRSQLVTANAFRADYVRRKFDILLDELDVPETLEMVNTNVEQLDFFLSYYNDMRLQWQGAKANRLTLILTVVLMFMALSSFLADTFDVFDSGRSNRLYGPLTGPQWAMVCFGALTVSVIIWQLWRLAQGRRK